MKKTLQLLAVSLFTLGVSSCETEDIESIEASFQNPEKPMNDNPGGTHTPLDHLEH